MSTTPQQPTKPEPPSPVYTYIAVGLAALTAGGGLYLNLVDQKNPCPLCFYQRAFAYASLGVLVAGLFTKLNDRVAVATLTLPVAFAGLGVALWHVQLERNGTLECPLGAFGLGTAPQQSAVMFGLLCSALMIDAYQIGRPGCDFVHVVGSVGTGVVLAGLCLLGNPPLPEPPTKPYEEQEPKTCRRPYKTEQSEKEAK